MRNIEASIENLRNATGNGAEHYCFFLEDPVPFNPSYFYWYAEQSDLYKALIEDLWAMLFDDEEDEEVENFINEIEKIVNELKLKRTPVFLELTKRIQDVWSEFDNSANFNFAYIGTYDSLCKGNSEFEKLIRNIFRHGKEESKHHKAQAITEYELDEFNEFISTEI